MRGCAPSCHPVDRRLDRDLRHRSDSEVPPLARGALLPLPPPIRHLYGVCRDLGAVFGGLPDGGATSTCQRNLANCPEAS